MRVNLGQANHAVTPEVGAGLVHLIRGHGVVTRFTTGVGDRQRRDDACVADAIPVEEGDALDARLLPGELVEECVPKGLRQDEAHPDRCSGEGRAPRPGG